MKKRVITQEVVTNQGNQRGSTGARRKGTSSKTVLKIKTLEDICKIHPELRINMKEDLAQAYLAHGFGRKRLTE